MLESLPRVIQKTLHAKNPLSLRPTDKSPHHVNTLLHILIGRSHSQRNSPACEHLLCTASSTANTPNCFQLKGCFFFFPQPNTNTLEDRQQFSGRLSVGFRQCCDKLSSSTYIQLKMENYPITQDLASAP